LVKIQSEPTGDHRSLLRSTCPGTREAGSRCRGRGTDRGRQAF